MGQDQFANGFVNAMLGWIRWVADRIARMFQTSSAQGSSGNALLNWFSQNWVTLLVTLVVLGVVADWLVWLVRWRPYWVWFHKKRVLMDDDIDIDLSDEELMRRFGPLEPKVDKRAHFRASELGRAGRPIYQPDDETAELYEDEDEEDGPDLEDPLFGRDAYDEDDDYVPPKRVPHTRQQFFDEDDDYDEEDDDRFDQLYDDEGEEYDEEGLDDDEDVDFLQADGGEDPDLSALDADEDAEDDGEAPQKRVWFKGMLRKRRHDADEDPFSVDDDEFDDPDDDFYAVVSDLPNIPARGDERAEPPVQDATSIYQPLDVELAPETPAAEQDWRTGYSVKNPLPDAASASRRARRHTREVYGDKDE